MKGFYYLLLVPLFFISCSKEDENQEPLELNAVQMEAVYANNEFGMEVLKYFLQADDKDNPCISPLSISLALGMTANGALGETQEQMKTVLGYDKMEMNMINDLFRDIISVLPGLDPKVSFTTANSIWYRNDFVIEDSFLSINNGKYFSDLYSRDFSEPGLKDEINQWVEDNTNGKIEEIIDNIQPESVMFLINALYFNGQWKHSFHEDNVKESVFISKNDEQVPVTMMYANFDLPYYEHDIFRAVEMPYGNGQFTCLFFLPNSEYYMSDVANYLASHNFLDHLDLYEEYEVHIALPKFEIEYENELNTVLQSMGMHLPFSDGADFSNISKYVGLKIDKVKHKTYLKMDEKGTEAAAATSVEIVYNSVTGKMFYMNRPFLFAIGDRTTGSIIFTGVLDNPPVE